VFIKSCLCLRRKVNILIDLSRSLLKIAGFVGNGKVPDLIKALNSFLLVPYLMRGQPEVNTHCWVLLDNVGELDF